MNFQQIETLIWIARLGGFSAAAEQMRTTQPAISKRVLELERELGVTLFERGRRGIRITPKGRECLAYAEQILSSVAGMRSQVSARSQMSGRVNLGVNELIAQTWLADLLSRLANEYPSLVIDPTVDITPPLLQGMRDGHFDVVLVGGIGVTTEYPSVDLGFSRYVWMAKPGSDDFSQPLQPKDLQCRRILTWNKQAAIHQHVLNWFVQHGAFPANRLLCNSTMSIATLTAAGLGIGLLPVELFRKELQEGTLCIVPTIPDFQPVRYQAIYIPTLWPPFGRRVAEVAAALSQFNLTPSPA